MGVRAWRDRLPIEFASTGHPIACHFGRSACAGCYQLTIAKCPRFAPAVACDQFGLLCVRWDPTFVGTTSQHPISQ